MEPKHLHVGKVMDAHGIKGDLYCIVFSGDVSWIDDVETLRLKDKDHTIKRIKPFKKGFIVSLEGFDNRNLAEAHIGHELWVPEGLFVSEDGEALFLKEILGFKVKDEALGEIGVVTGFSSNTSQDLLVITQGVKTFDIPFVEAFVKNIDHEKKEILMSLPEGLLDINEADSL